LFGLLSFIFFSTDQILLGKLKGTIDVGYYSIVTKIILLIGLIPGLIMTALFPHLSSKINNKEFMKKIFRKVGWGFLILGFSLAVFGAVSAPIIPLIVGLQYGPSVKLFQFFIWILIFISPTILFDSVLFAYNKQWLNFWFTGGCAILNLVLNLLLIPYYGMFGAAAASIIAQFLNFAISWHLSRRVMNDALKLSAIIDNP